MREITIEIRGIYTIEVDGDLEDYTDEELEDWAIDYYGNSSLNEFEFEVHEIEID